MSTNTHETNSDKDLPFESLVNAVRDQSRIWAKYGLTVSKLALETHARAVTSLAATIGSVAEAIVPKAEEPASKTEE
jgi:hypothetical protein